jgi:hypothetical protein
MRVAPTDLAPRLPTRARIILLVKVTFPIRTQARRGTERPRVTQADVHFGGRFWGQSRHGLLRRKYPLMTQSGHPGVAPKLGFA